MYTLRHEPGGVSFYGLSSDEKPQFIEYVKGMKESIPNGTPLYNMDNGALFMYDAANNVWIEQ